jgi:hypothetical protein
MGTRRGNGKVVLHAVPLLRPGEFRAKKLRASSGKEGSQLMGIRKGATCKGFLRRSVLADTLSIENSGAG